MWNSYVDKDVINTMKNLTAKYSKWFYFRNNNSRMINEEILTFLSYLNYMSCNSKKELLDIYKLQNRMCFRIKSKRVITEALKQASLNLDYKNRWLKAIKGTELLIRKVEFILIDRDIVVSRNEFLKKELDKLFSVNFSSVRRIQDMYALWYILNPLSLNMVKAHRTKIKEELSDIFVTMKNNPTYTVTSFKERILEFQSCYIPEERGLRLSKGEINTYISAQGNLCPICKETLFIGDTTHNDHIVPLAVGGKDQIENIQVVHAVCNLSKGCKF